MKNSHKIALYLGIFLSLSIASYFLISYLTHSSTRQSDQSDEEQRGLKNETLQSEELIKTAEELTAATAATAALPSKTSEFPSSPAQSAGTEEASAAAAAAVTTSGSAGTSANSHHQETSSSSSTLSSSYPLPSTSSTTAAEKQLDSDIDRSNLAKQANNVAVVAETTAAAASTSASGANNEQLTLPAESMRKFPNNSTAFDLYTQVTKQPIDFYDISDSERNQWEEFKKRYRKVYGNEQMEMKRQEIFVGNLRFIETFNRLSGAQFKLEMNHFGDYENDEINQLFIGPNSNWTQTIGQMQSLIPPAFKILDPSSSTSSLQTITNDVRNNDVDWRQYEGSEPVDQGECRESSIFAIVANLEAKINLEQSRVAPEAAARQKIKLSETQLLDCLHSIGLPICSGNISMMQVYDYLQRNQIRLATAQEYGDFQQAKLAGKVAQNVACNIFGGAEQQQQPRPIMQSFTDVHRDNLDEALQIVGPLVVAIDASQPTFHFYKSGIYHENNCSQDSYNYHVLLVGQQQQQQQVGDLNEHQMAPQSTYWIRSSFGTDWGQMGHMQLAKDTTRNKCLPQNLAIYPNIIIA